MQFRLKSDKDRKIHLNMEQINAYVLRYVPDTWFDFEIVRRQGKKSDPMRRYYFSTVITGLMRACGYDPEEKLDVHRQLKIIYFGVEPDKHGIYREKDIPSVFGKESELDISVKIKFTEWVCRKAAENGEYVPPPGHE